MLFREQPLPPDALDVLEPSTHWSDAIPDGVLVAAFVVGLPLLWWFVYRRRNRIAFSRDWFDNLTDHGLVLNTVILTVMAVAYVVVSLITVAGC